MIRVNLGGNFKGPCMNSCIAVFLRLWFADHWWSAGGFKRKSIAKIVSDAEQIKNTPMPVCAESAFVG
jgi:hypothetical protein